jgi:branched-chain amino acid transport system substrate-binding protein
MKKLHSCLMLAAILLVVAGCTPGPSRGEVTVFVAAPLSGWQADGGQTVVGGVNLMADELNKTGGLLGYRIQVVAVDDEGDSDVAAEVAERIAEAVRAGDRVLGIVGHYNSGQTLSAMEVYKDLPIIVVTPTASDVSITRKGYRNFFRVNATDAAQGPVDARFLVETVGAKRIAVVHANNEYGRGLRDQFVQALATLDLEPVGVFEIVEAADTHASVIPKIKSAQPEAVFLAGYETEGYVLLPEIREAGIDVPFMASDGCFLYEFIDGSGTAAEGAYVSGITPDPKTAAGEDWWKAYQMLENRNPGTYSIAGYSAMAVIAEGVREAKSLDATSVADAIRRLDLVSLVGHISYDDRGDLREQKVYVFQVRNGDFAQVQP